jgi:hypothetical protein
MSASSIVNWHYGYGQALANPTLPRPICMVGTTSTLSGGAMFKVMNSEMLASAPNAI